MDTDTHRLPKTRTLRAIVDDTVHLDEVTKDEVNLGDRVQIRTRNSVYLIQVLGNGLYLISGGWVFSQGMSAMKTTIAGCTWGGAALKSNIVAARGLHLEFGDGVVTSTILKVRVLPSEERRFVH